MPPSRAPKCAMDYSQILSRLVDWQRNTVGCPLKDSSRKSIKRGSSRKVGSKLSMVNAKHDLSGHVAVKMFGCPQLSLGKKWDSLHSGPRRSIWPQARCTNFGCTYPHPYRDPSFLRIANHEGMQVASQHKRWVRRVGDQPVPTYLCFFWFRFLGKNMGSEDQPSEHSTGSFSAPDAARQASRPEGGGKATAREGVERNDRNSFWARHKVGNAPKLVCVQIGDPCGFPFGFPSARGKG